LIHFANLSAFEFTKINSGLESINMGNTHIALLRGINVSGQKKIKMADLRQVLQENGLKTSKPTSKVAILFLMTNRQIGVNFRKK